jgi:hypothetical protein
MPYHICLKILFVLQVLLLQNTKSFVTVPKGSLAHSFIQKKAGIAALN